MKETGAAMKNEAGAEMTADEAKQKVLAVHPKAVAMYDPCSRSHPPHRFIWTLYSGDKRVLAREFSEKELWIDAASKLPTPIPTPASEAEKETFSSVRSAEGWPAEPTKRNTLDVDRAEKWLDTNHPEFTNSRQLAEVMHDYSLSCLPTPPSTEESGEPDQKCKLPADGPAPCPFCGSPASKPELQEPRNGRTQRPIWEIGCGNFCVSMRRGSKREAISDWNKRSTQPAFLGESADYLRGKLDDSIWNAAIEAAADSGVHTQWATNIRKLKRGNS